MFGREPCIKHEKQSESDVRNGFLKNDRVYVKPAVPSSHEQWWEGVVTRDGKGVVVEVNNVNRHIADVRKIPTVAGDLSNPVGTETEERPEEATSHNAVQTSNFIDYDVHRHTATSEDESDVIHAANESEDTEAPNNRPLRVRRRPSWLNDYVNFEDH